MNWFELKKELEKLFCENELENDLSDIDWIGTEVLKVPRSMLGSVQNISENDLKKIKSYVKKRLKHIPLDYILGKSNFYGYDFVVNPNVLIPRADTEVLIEKVVSSAKKRRKRISILDIGTGSGAIAVTLKKELDADVFAVDVNKAALEVAKLNAKSNNADIVFIESDIFENVDELKFDFIVSNPPYINTAAIYGLESEVKDNEPILALDGGTDGLDYYRRIINDSKKFLNKNGELWFEIGFDQAESVSKLMEGKFNNICVYKDFGGNDRIVMGEIL